MTDSTAAPSPAPEKANLLDDFVDIFASPSKVFARRATANPMVPFLIVWLLLVGMFFVNRNMMAPVIDLEVQKQMEAAMKSNPQITPEIADRMKAASGVTISVSGIAGPPIALLVLAFATWLVAKILGGTMPFGTALLVASFSWIPRVVESVLWAAEGLVLDTTKMATHYELTLSLARVLDPSTSVGMLGLAGRVDLITFWVTALLAIGLVAAGKVAKERRFVAAVVMWAVGSVFALWGALRG